MGMSYLPCINKPLGTEGCNLKCADGHVENAGALIQTSRAKFVSEKRFLIDLIRRAPPVSVSHITIRGRKESTLDP